MERLNELLNSENSYLKDGEILIYVKDNQMSALYNDEESLTSVNGSVNDKLKEFLIWLLDDNQY